MTKEKSGADAVGETVHILGSLDRGLDQVDKQLSNGKGVLFIDFSACSFIAVDGLEWLEELMLRADSLKREVRFVNVPPQLYKVFKIAHIESLIAAAGGVSRTTGPYC